MEDGGFRVVDLLLVGQDRVHRDGLERGRAGAGELLPESVPVVKDLDPGMLRGDHGDLAAGAGRMRHGDGDPIGVDRAGAIVFLAIEDPAFSLLGNGRVKRAQPVPAALGIRVADDLAGNDALDPAVPQGIVLKQQHGFDEADV